MKIDKVSHLDHGLTPAHVAWLQEKFAGRDAFFIETVTIPEELDPVVCALYGPVMGDEPVGEGEVRYVVREGRNCATRVLRWESITPSRRTRLLTVVAGPAGGAPCTLYTAYGGPAAPREPGDLSLPSWAEIEKSRAFWADHALSLSPVSQVTP